MDLSALLLLLKPVLASEGAKLVDGVLMPALQAEVAKLSNPIEVALANALMPVLKAALDAEIAKLSA
jgi:hypothetical protein